MTPEPKTITILSLGAGVQSTALALMAEEGLIEPVVAAVFSDTGDEPQELYEHIERLRGMVSYPIHIVRQGPSLIQDFMDHLEGKTPSSAQPPFYVRAPELSEEEIAEVLTAPEPKWEDFKDLPVTGATSGPVDELFRHDVVETLYQNAWAEWNLRKRKAMNKDEGGMLWRKCTRDWKIVPIRRAVRELMKEHGAKHARSIIGISTDERQRQSESGRKFITNVHPLLDMGWSRSKCIDYLATKGLKIPKSACIYCPCRSNAGWKRFKAELPAEFERACQIDEKMREIQGRKLNGAALVGQLYVWRGFKPLRTAEFDTAKGQLDFGFEQECDGMCGH